MKKTPLYDQHLKLGAKMVPFANYEMPVMYSGIKEEHMAVRENAGMFDVSHMAQFCITGKGARHFINHLTVNDVNKLSPGLVQYSAVLNEAGGVLDDVLVYQIEAERFQVVVNASNREKIYQWFESHLERDVLLDDKSEDWGIIALQGPRAVEVFEKTFDCPVDLKTYTAQERELFGKTCVLSRTGYTGEDGLEIFAPKGVLESFWLALLEAGVAPCGLGARDTLRLEVGYSLYGHELSEEWDPISSGIGWICPKEKGEFIGSSALESIRHEGPVANTVGLEMIDKAIPRQGCKIFKGEFEIGVITSGSQGPSLGKFVAMARIQKPYAEVGAKVLVDVRGKLKEAKIVSKRFYKGN